MQYDYAVEKNAKVEIRTGAIIDRNETKKNLAGKK